MVKVNSKGMHIMEVMPCNVNKSDSKLMNKMNVNIDLSVLKRHENTYHHSWSLVHSKPR